MASSGNMYVLPYLFSSSSSSSSLDRPNFKIYKLKYSQHLVENTDSAHSTHSRDSQVINRKLSNSVDTLDDLAQIQITTPKKKKSVVVEDDEVCVGPKISNLLAKHVKSKWWNSLALEKIKKKK